MNKSIRLPPLPTWDAHWPSSSLRKEQVENPRAFARGFQMRAFTDDERMFPSFKGCFSHGQVLGNIQRGGWPIFVGVDLAGKNRPGNVIFVVAVEPATQRRYPLEIACGAWSSPETAKRIADVHARYANVRYIMVENNGYQQALIDWIRHAGGDRSFWYKIESFTTTSQNKMKAEIGLPSLEVEFKNKAWVVPADEFELHPPTCRCGWCVWVTETSDYPMSATTDTVMAMWFAREAIAKWGGSFGSGTGNLGLADLNTR